MAAMFLARRGTISICRASSLHKDYNNSARSIANGGNNEREKSKEEAMGTTTDGKAPNVTMSHAADTTKEGLKRATNVATEKNGDASKHKCRE
ncbi:hypothetical protein V5N11_015322 [Cardamine amara subsp. amara]|uniref:Uncharacterized protein n=1 Tax=Cardamine amara subsp. amara TaxID=228776 RepID=A0ABD1A8D3_CARAN